MKSSRIVLTYAAVFVIACGAGVLAQSGSSGGNTVAAHMTAAKAAADDSWLILYSELCGAAVGAGGRASSVAARTGGAGRAGGAAPAAGRQAGPPPREVWYRDPVKVFDNMYVFPTDDVNAWAIQTSAGIIMIDATFDYSVKDLIVDAMPKVGLDPKQIKYVVVTHGHADHSAGAKYLQDTYGAKILMSEADWTLVAQPPRGGGAGSPAPNKDIVVSDGQKLTLGDTTMTMYLTPGHTLGTISLMIPVKDGGKTHMAAFWGGTAISRTTTYDNLVAYSSSAQKFEKLAAAAGADVLLSNHGRYFDLDKRVGANRANPAGPNAFILTPARVRGYLQVADHCAQAVALSQNAVKTP
jgi:metallo-beta-lactamase class B